MTLMGVESMPKKEKHKRDDKSAKLDRAVLERAQIIARQFGLSLAEYLTNLVRPGVDKDWPKVLKKLNASDRPREDE